jgi:hypothetical protein
MSRNSASVTPHSAGPRIGRSSSRFFSMRPSHLVIEGGQPPLLKITVWLGNKAADKYRLAPLFGRADVGKIPHGHRWDLPSPPSAATPLSDRESPLQASFPRNLGLCFAPKASTPSRKSSELPRKVTGSSQRSPLHAAGTRRCLHFGKCACKQAATCFPPIRREASPTSRP